MAKKGHRIQVILESTESGHCYHSERNKNNTKDKLEIKKFDPFVRKHVNYREKK